jgi:hypothetical protein
VVRRIRDIEEQSVWATSLFRREGTGLQISAGVEGPQRRNSRRGAVASTHRSHS